MCIAKSPKFLRAFVDALVLFCLPEIAVCFEEILPTAELQYKDLKMAHRLRSNGPAI